MTASACHVISKEVVNRIVRHNPILDTHVCINKPYWQSIGVIVILCEYYTVISDKLIGSWMCFSCCSLFYWQSILRNQEGKIELQKIVHRRICVRDITFLSARRPYYVIFCCFFAYSLQPSTLNSRKFFFFCFRKWILSGSQYL